MSYIKCNVKNCMYNMKSRCYKKSISISGLLAKNSDNTFCESFDGGNQVVEFASFSDSNQIVYCNAISCRHLSNGICKAKEISVGGKIIKISSQSFCETFIEE